MCEHQKSTSESKILNIQGWAVALPGTFGPRRGHRRRAEAKCVRTFFTYSRPIQAVHSASIVRGHHWLKTVN